MRGGGEAGRGHGYIAQNDGNVRTLAEKKSSEMNRSKLAFWEG